MGRIAHGEIGADREAGNGFLQFRQRRLQRVQHERVGVAVDIVAARTKNHRVGAERRAQAVAGKIGLGEAHHHQRHAAALPLDQRIGGERGRHRGELDRRRVDAGLLQHRVDGTGNALRQIVAGGQRLGLGEHGAALAASLRPQNRVGIGAAGVDAEKERAGKQRRRGLGFHSTGVPDFLRLPLDHRCAPRKALGHYLPRGEITGAAPLALPALGRAA